MTTGAKGIIPFSGGAQYSEFGRVNCDNCKKGGDETEPGSSKCDLFEDMADLAGGFGEGLTVEQAKRLGYDGGISYVWKCGEFEVKV